MSLKDESIQIASSSSDTISDDESESEYSSMASSIDELSDVSDDDAKPSVKRVRVSLSPTAPAASIRNDSRSFLQFMEEEGLVEVVRNWKKYPAKSKLDIEADGAIWIDGQKTPVIISKETQDIMKNEGLWGKDLFIGKQGYVVTNSHIPIHSKIASSKKDADFHYLLELGWKGKKIDLEVLHLNDCPFDFNIENLVWHTHGTNMRLRLSKGTTHRNKFRCSTNINGNIEQGSHCTTILEARHAIDVLKINNVEDFQQELVFNHGMNFTYPSIELLLARTHLYKSDPTHQGQPFRSNGIFTLCEWKEADTGLKEAVENSGYPFDPKLDVLVHYHGQKGKGITIMFVIERACFNKHILNQQASLGLGKGYVLIRKEGNKFNGIHRLVLGLETGDKAKVARHRVGGMDGRRDNRKRVLRTGNHASNMMDRSQKTATSTSQFDGVSWNKLIQHWVAQMCFSNGHFSINISLGRFGVKGNRNTGEVEASAFREKVRDNVERINELLKDVTNLDVYKRRVREEIKKLKKSKN